MSFAVVNDSGAVSLPAGLLPSSQRNFVIFGFLAGWRLTELFDGGGVPLPPPAVDEGRPPAQLPRLGELTGTQHAQMLVEQVTVAFKVLGAGLGVAMPGMDLVRDAVTGGAALKDVQREVRAVYDYAHQELLGVAPLAAIGFGLGQLLADNVYLAQANPASFRYLFSADRVDNACGWLEDLATAFPPGSASAVRASLTTWRDWVSPQPPRADASGAPDYADAVRAVRLQGHVWRRLLAGEKDPSQLLQSDDYVKAGEFLLKHGRQIVLHYLRRYWLVPVLIFVAVVSAAWAAISFAPAGAARVTAVVFSAAAALGLWRGLAATLGKALDKAESALWDSEVRAATGRAATITPASRATTQAPPGTDT
jgi:hypothetical protein